MLESPLGTHADSVFKDYRDLDFRDELKRVHEETAIERTWMEQAEAVPFLTDEAILEAANDGALELVSRGAGYLVIKKLLLWKPDRSDPTQENFYSPPYLAANTFMVLESLAAKWQAELGQSRFLSITSLTRSMEYQTELARRPGALTINEPGMLSSHTVGWSFDVDACGLYEEADTGEIRAINPRAYGYNRTLAAESRLVLREMLVDLRSEGRINFVEELPGSTRHCFHVCVKPDSLQAE